MKEGEPPPTDVLLEGPDLSQKERVAWHQRRLADEAGQIAVVVAHDIDRLHLVQSRQQVQVRHDGPAHVGLPEIKQITQDIELSTLGVHVVQKLVEAGFAAFHGEVIAVATVAQMQVTHTEDGHGFFPLRSHASLANAGRGPATRPLGGE